MSYGHEKFLKEMREARKFITDYFETVERSFVAAVSAGGCEAARTERHDAITRGVDALHPTKATAVIDAYEQLMETHAEFGELVTDVFSLQHSVKRGVFVNTESFEAVRELLNALVDQFATEFDKLCDALAGESMSLLSMTPTDDSKDDD